jgi:hypothetical protein
MFKKLRGLILILSLLLTFSCTTLEKANKGAKEVGKPVGKVLRVPGSLSEGVAKGIAGEPESNPYNR